MRRTTLYLVLLLSYFGSEASLRGDDPRVPRASALPLTTFAVVDDSAAIASALRVILPEDLVSTTYAKAFEAIRSQAGRPLDIDRESLLERGFDIDKSDTPTPLIAKGTPLYKALDILCRDAIQTTLLVQTPVLAWAEKNGMIRVATPADINEIRETRLFPVGDLRKAECSPAELTSCVENSVSWPWDFSEPGTGLVTQQGSQLLVWQNGPAHREVTSLLAGLRSNADVVWCGRTERDREIALELDSRVVRFPGGEFSAEAFAREMERLTGVPMVFTPAALNSKTDGLEGTLRPIEGIWQHVLETILGDPGIDVRDGRVWIHDDHCSPETRFSAVYNLRSTIFDWHTPTKLFDVVTEMVSAHWDHEIPEGGTVSILWKRGQVVVWNDLRTQLEVERLLREVSRAEPEADPDSVETRRYAFRNETAEDLAAAIPLLVAPETWRSSEHLDRPGIVVRVRRPDSSSKAQSAGPGYEVLVVRHSVRVLQEVERLMVDLGWEADPDYETTRQPGDLPEKAAAPDHPRGFRGNK